MEEFKARLAKFFSGHLGMSQNSFEDSCGITHGTISSIKVKGPSVDVLAKISSAYPDLDLNWLVTGKGTMVNTGGKKEQERKEENGPHSLPLIPLEAFAGPGLPAYEDERIEDYYTVSEFKNSDFLIRVKGDSMVPRYNGGDIVACKKVEMDKVYFLQWNRAYVILTQSQGVMIKRVQPSERDGYIKCVSDNERYAPFDVPMNDIVQIALVNGAITLD